jgi:Ulp1 family protease
MNGAGTKYLEAAQRWIVDEAKAKKNMIIDPNEYKLVKKQLSMPQQNNGYDCGVFSTMCADYLSDDLPLNCYSQTEMNMFRVKIGAAILRGSLNYSF